ncbi:MAG: TGS domain-containing protein [Candidatus Caldarchaeum sp.]
MPTNLPAEAQAKLAKYQEARTIKEKIKALEEALPLIPDHKGTEKMRAQLKTTLARLRRELERKKAVKTSRQDAFAVKKEGAATIVLLGVANSGKSTMLRSLTNARPEVSSYELTTTKPIPAMMYVEEVGIQLVELPAVLTSSLEETPFASRSIALARNADLLALALDCFGDPVEQFDKLVAMLDDAGIVLGSKNFDVVVEKKDSGGIRLVVFGRFRGTSEELRQALQQIGVKNAVVKIYGEAGVEEVVDHVLRQSVFKKAIVVAGRCDLCPKPELEKLRDKARKLGIGFVSVTYKNPSTYMDFKRTAYSLLDLVRVYTQKDGVVDRKPIVVSRGTKIAELAFIIHKEIAKNLKYARVWGPSVKIQGQQVGPEHVLQDGDVVELFV